MQKGSKLKSFLLVASQSPQIPRITHDSDLFTAVVHV